MSKYDAESKNVEEQPDLERQGKALVDRFDLDDDPLAEYAPIFEQLETEEGVDPFEMFLEEILAPDSPSDGTLDAYERSFRYWREHMGAAGRHPACPNETHVRTFIRSLRDRGLEPPTIKQHIRQLRRAYRYWQDEEKFPHPTTSDPFKSARKKESFGTKTTKKPPNIGVEELRERLSAVTHIRDRAIIVAQLKLGLRAGEVCNLQLQDVSIDHGDLRRHYPALGTHTELQDRENAIYIAPKDERDGNKSEPARLLPLDDEMRAVLIRYLLIRPETGDPWVFLTKDTHTKPYDEKPLNRAWREAFPDEKYGETETTRAVTSHFGRHRFTTYWRVEQGVNDRLVEYMRGDVPGALSDRSGVIDEYTHPEYEHIRDLYLENIYKLLIQSPVPIF